MQELMRLTPGPNRTITFKNEAGEEAILDYSGDSITYSGDLPVDEAARLFFTYVQDFILEAVTERAE